MLQFLLYFIVFWSLKNLIRTSATEVCIDANWKQTLRKEGVWSTFVSEITFGKLSSKTPQQYYFSSGKLSLFISLSFRGLKILKSSQIRFSYTSVFTGYRSIVCTSLFQFRRSSIDLFFFYIYSIFGICRLRISALATKFGTDC